METTKVKSIEEIQYEMRNDMRIILAEIDRLNYECEKLIVEIGSIKDHLIEFNSSEPDNE